MQRNAIPARQTGEQTRRPSPSPWAKRSPPGRLWVGLATLVPAATIAVTPAPTFTCISSSLTRIRRTSSSTSSIPTASSPNRNATPRESQTQSAAPALDIPMPGREASRNIRNGLSNMSFLKELRDFLRGEEATNRSSSEISPQNPLFVYIRIPGDLDPDDREELFSDPLRAALEKKALASLQAAARASCRLTRQTATRWSFAVSTWIFASLAGVWIYCVESSRDSRRPLERRCFTRWMDTNTKSRFIACLSDTLTYRADATIWLVANVPTNALRLSCSVHSTPRSRPRYSSVMATAGMAWVVWVSGG